MNENLVFEGQDSQKDQNNQPGQDMQPVQEAPVTQPSPAQPTPIVSGPTEILPSSFGSPPAGSSFFSRSTLIKGVVGIVILVLLFFLVTRIILPQFSKKSSSQTVTITYWGLWEDPKVMNTIIADFERKNPTIKVIYEQQDIKQYKDRLLTRIGNGTGPDIFRFHNTWYPMLRTVLLPLPQQVITADSFKKNYYTVAQTDLIHNGAIYGLPLEIDTLSLFVNTQMFKDGGYEVPNNWDDFVKVAKNLTTKESTGEIKKAGAALGTYTNINHAPEIISMLLVQNGANLNNLSATSQNTSEALEFYTSFTTDTNSVWNNSLDSSLVMFAGGNLAMYFGYSWDIFEIDAKKSPDLEYKIYSVPTLAGRKTTIASYWVEGVSVRSKHVKEADLFMTFLAQKETQQKLYTEAAKTRLIGEPYARIDLGQTLKDNPIIYPFIKQAPDAVSSFFASDTHDDSSANPGINTRMNQYLENAINSMNGNTSAQSATETLAKGVSQTLQLYGQK